MLVDYSVTEMVSFDNYLDTAPSTKTMRGTGITNFLLHVNKFITFNKLKIVTATLIVEAVVKSL